MSGRTITAGNVLIFRVWVQDFEQASVNTFYLAVDTVTGAPDESGAAQAFDNLMAPLMKPMLYTGAIYRGTQCRIQNELPLAIMQSYVGNAGAGTGGSTGLPRQTCGLTSWRTAIAGPGYRGRTYWPFPYLDADMDAGQPTAAYITLMANIASTLVALTTLTMVGGSAGVNLVLHSKVHAVNTDIETFLTSIVWATQRKRGSYGRPNQSPI